MTQEEATNWALNKIESAMRPKQPTAAAMRAAKEMGRNKCPPWGEFAISQNAAIIDRKTGLPELIEACKTALHAVDVSLCGTPSAHYFEAIKKAMKIATGSSIEDNLAANVTEIKGECEKARSLIVAALQKAEPYAH